MMIGIYGCRRASSLVLVVVELCWLFSGSGGGASVLAGTRPQYRVSIDFILVKLNQEVGQGQLDYIVMLNLQRGGKSWWAQ